MLLRYFRVYVSYHDILDRYPLRARSGEVGDIPMKILRTQSRVG